MALLTLKAFVAYKKVKTDLDSAPPLCIMKTGLQLQPLVSTATNPKGFGGQNILGCDYTDK
jgi:hypothetical protein